RSRSQAQPASYSIAGHALVSACSARWQTGEFSSLRDRYLHRKKAKSARAVATLVCHAKFNQDGRRAVEISLISLVVSLRPIVMYSG
ncbi:hypothetical protein R1flu_008774, partial [Riccia fluitans]